MRNPIQFGDLIQPLDKNTFFNDVYGQTPVFFSGHNKRFSRLFSWSTYNQLLSMSSIWSEKTTKLVLHGRSIAAEEYCHPVTDRNGYTSLQPYKRRIQENLAQGATLVLELAERLSPGLSEIADAFQVALGAPVACNIYCSWEGHRGFPAHFDTMDVFALQIEGRKTWRLYNGKFDNPIEQAGYQYPSFSREHHNRSKGQVVKEVLMTPGDILYVPRGQYHDALATDGASLHLSFGVTEATGQDVIRILLNSIVSDSLFRATLPHFDDIESHQRHLSKLADRLGKALRDTEASKVVRDYQRKRALRDFHCHYELPGHDSRTIYRSCNKGIYSESKENQLTITQQGASKTVTGDEATLHEWLYAHDYFTKAQLHKEFPVWSIREMENKLQSLIDDGLIETIAPPQEKFSTKP